MMFGATGDVPAIVGGCKKSGTHSYSLRCHGNALVIVHNSIESCRNCRRSLMEVCLGMLQLNAVTVAGLVLIALGIVSFAIPIFTTSQTKDVANIGDLKLQTTQSTSYTIPPLASAAALVVGVVLVGAGVARRRT
jgi:hypothetical protein